VKISLLVLILICWISLPILSAEAAPALFYVSPMGNDSWSGKMPSTNHAHTDGPFKTIQMARDQIRKEKVRNSSRSYEVLIRGGIYELDTTLTFSSDDSGSPNYPVIYAAYEREEPIITISHRILGEWRRHKVNPSIWQATIPGVGEGKRYFRNLYVKGARRLRPRWPKQGYFQIEGLLPGAIRGKRSDPTARSGFRFRDKDIDPTWKNRHDIEVVTIGKWLAPRRNIKDIDEHRRLVTFNELVSWPYGWPCLNYYYVENVYEKLAPGEWYLDRQSGELSFWPLPGEDIESLEIRAPKSPGDIIYCDEKAGYLKFIGLSFCYSDCSFQFSNDPGSKYPHDADYIRGGDAIVIEGHHIAVDGCKVSHIAGHGVTLGSRSRNCLVQRCNIYDTGAGSIRMTGKDCEVLNNYLHDGGIIDLGSFALYVGAHNAATHNEVYNFPYLGIISRGADATVAFNHVHHVMEILSDGGGIYRGRNPDGASITNNLVHDIGNTSILKISTYGIYLDDGAHDVLVKNNIVYNTMSASIMLHHGHSNTIENNIFAFSNTEGLMRRSKWFEGEGVGWTVQRNILVNDGTTSGRRDMLVPKCKDRRYKFDHNVYYTMNNKPLFYGMEFKEWKTTRSLLLEGANWNPKGHSGPEIRTIGAWEGGEWVDGELQDVNSIIADPLFISLSEHNFNLKPESAAFKMGFQAIDISAIGVH
jgi:parallel beta-helix repeat protein